MVEEKLKQKSVILRPSLVKPVTGALPPQASKERRGHPSKVGGPAWDRGKREGAGRSAAFPRECEVSVVTLPDLYLKLEIGIFS